MISIPLNQDETPSKNFLQVENQVENLDEVEKDEFRDPVPTSHLSIKTFKSPEKSVENSENSENSPPKYIPHFDSPAKNSNPNPPAKTNGSILKEDLLKTAPVVPFFTGLSHWGEDQRNFQVDFCFQVESFNRIQLESDASHARTRKRTQVSWKFFRTWTRNRKNWRSFSSKNILPK